jgi:hypothetical protein
MSKFSACVSFYVETFEAHDKDEANIKLNKLIDQLVTAETSLTWDGVEIDLWNEEV